jgi:hypothetical protein
MAKVLSEILGVLEDEKDAPWGRAPPLAYGLV